MESEVELERAVAGADIGDLDRTLRPRRGGDEKKDRGEEGGGANTAGVKVRRAAAVGWTWGAPFQGILLVFGSRRIRTGG